MVIWSFHQSEIYKPVKAQVAEGFSRWEDNPSVHWNVIISSESLPRNSQSVLFSRLVDLNSSWTRVAPFYNLLLEVKWLATSLEDRCLVNHLNLNVYGLATTKTNDDYVSHVNLLKRSNIFIDIQRKRGKFTEAVLFFGFKRPLVVFMRVHKSEKSHLFKELAR